MAWQAEIAGMPIIMMCLSCVSSLAYGDINSLRASCQHQLWLTGMQLSHGEFGGLDGNGYLEHMLVAITSAKAHAPSLLPVVVLMASDKTLDGSRAKLMKAGAVAVIYHTLSFESSLLEAAGEEKEWVERALGSYLRLDIPSFLPEVMHAVAGRDVETGHILWTDPDVMFRSNIDSCTLAKPPLIALGPDVARGRTDSAGIIYMNVSAYEDIFPGMVEHAISNKFSTDSVAMDQNMLLRYIEGFSTLLPDVFNYKPYWGLPKPVVNIPSGDPVIVHMQGPKPDRAVCALRSFRVQKPTLEQLTGHNWPGRSETLRACHLDNARHIYFAWDLEDAYGVDKGEMYFQVNEEFNRHRQALRHDSAEV